jgi:ABC-type antimicrobial peptide transport system permease subunit
MSKSPTLAKRLGIGVTFLLFILLLTAFEISIYSSFRPSTIVEGWHIHIGGSGSISSDNFVELKPFGTAYIPITTLLTVLAVFVAFIVVLFFSAYLIYRLHRGQKQSRTSDMP